MKRYKRMILQAGNMQDLIVDIQYAFEYNVLEIEESIKERLSPADANGCRRVTGYYVVLKKRLTLWQWFKCIFWK